MIDPATRCFGPEADTRHDYGKLTRSEDHAGKVAALNYLRTGGGLRPHAKVGESTRQVASILSAGHEYTFTPRLDRGLLHLLAARSLSMILSVVNRIGD